MSEGRVEEVLTWLRQLEEDAGEGGTALCWPGAARSTAQFLFLWCAVQCRLVFDARHVPTGALPGALPPMCRRVPGLGGALPSHVLPGAPGAMRALPSWLPFAASKVWRLGCMLHLPPTCCARLCCWHSHQPALGPPSNSAPDFPQELKAALDEAIAALARRPDLAAALWERLVAAVVVQPAAGEAAAVPRYDLSYQLNEIEVRERGEQLKIARLQDCGVWTCRSMAAVYPTLLASCLCAVALYCRPPAFQLSPISNLISCAGTRGGLLRGTGLCAPTQRAVAVRWGRLCCGLHFCCVPASVRCVVWCGQDLSHCSSNQLAALWPAGGAELPDEGRGVAHRPNPCLLN